MSTITQRAALTIIAIVCGMPALALAQPADAAGNETAIVEQFNERVRGYVTLHRQVERALPPQRIFTDPEEAERVMTALATAMLEARPEAREGDIFAADITVVLKRRIRVALIEGGFDARALVREMTPEEPVDDPPPAVNGHFSWRLANFMPPCVLRVLPEVPIELQYRFVGADLVLIDLHANLVVDILRGVLPTVAETTHVVRRPPLDAAPAGSPGGQTFVPVC